MKDRWDGRIINSPLKDDPVLRYNLGTGCGELMESTCNTTMASERGGTKAKLRLLDYHEDQDAHIVCFLLKTDLVQLAGLLASVTLDFIAPQYHRTLPQSVEVLGLASFLKVVNKVIPHGDFPRP